MESRTFEREPGSLSGVISSLREDVRRLFQEEVHLAKKEVAEKGAILGRNALWLGVGGVLACLALTFFLVALSFAAAFGFQTLGLEPGIALLLGFAATALISGTVAAVLVTKALRALKSQSLVPEKTLETLREIKDGGFEQIDIPIRTVSAPPKDTRNSEQIRHEVEHARSRLSQDVRGLRQQLRPSNLALELAGRLVNAPLRLVSIGLGTGIAGWVLIRRLRFLGRRKPA